MLRVCIWELCAGTRVPSPCFHLASCLADGMDSGPTRNPNGRELCSLVRPCEIWDTVSLRNFLSQTQLQLCRG